MAAVAGSVTSPVYCPGREPVSRAADRGKCGRCDRWVRLLPGPPGHRYDRQSSRLRPHTAP